MQNFKSFITEAKQVGILYHYTSLRNMLDIIKNDTLIQGRPEAGETLGEISFTRIDREIHNILGCRFVIDGNKLSNNYKIEQYNWYKNITGKHRHKEKYDEREERVLGKNITDLSKYIIRLDIFKEELERSLELDYINNRTAIEFISYVQSLVPYEVKGI